MLLHSLNSSLWVDKNVLLVDVCDDGQEWSQTRLEEVFRNVGANLNHRGFVEVFAPLTSPFAYMRSIPRDPFLVLDRTQLEIDSVGDFESSKTYAYVVDDPEGAGIDHGLLAFSPEYTRESGRQPFQPGEYMLLAAGPDGHYSALDYNPNDIRYGLSYDASNGLVRAGDIILRNGGSRD